MNTPEDWARICVTEQEHDGMAICLDCFKAAIKERDEKWKEYLNLINEETKGFIGLAYSHGWRGSKPEVVEHSKRLRKELGLEEKP